MGSNFCDLLFELSEIDKKLVVAVEKKRTIEEEQRRCEEELAAMREKLSGLESQRERGAVRQKEEENRLQDEQRKIVERRKQLSSLGGVRGAKLVEREIDIASRVVQSMEEQTLKAMQEVEDVQGLIETLKSNAQQLETELAEKAPERKSSISGLDKEISSFGAQREKIISKLDDRLVRLYQKVSSRYPGDAVAVARKGSCRSCFRALPSQLYNQLLAGNLLIQCPGCMRLLVYVEDESNCPAG